MAAGRHFRFSPTLSSAIPSADPENPTVEQTGSGSDDPLQEYSHSKISKMTAGRHLGFAPTGSNAIQSADLENST